MDPRADHQGVPTWRGTMQQGAQCSCGVAQRAPHLWGMSLNCPCHANGSSPPSVVGPLMASDVISSAILHTGARDHSVALVGPAYE